MHFSYLVLFIIPYFLIISIFILGWYRIPAHVSNSTEKDILVSILIPIRNEELNLPFLISDLKNQNYPKDKTEIIFIDDHSTDKSVEIVRNSGVLNKLNQILSLPAHVNGKKMALWQGIKTAHGEFIITTDGDCRFLPAWIESMVSQFKAHPLGLIIGPVFMLNKDGFWNVFQSMEFLSLVASGAGAAGIGHPILCNGANLGVNRKLLDDVPEVYSSPLSSGDDIFLLLALKKKGISAHFVKDKQAMVETPGVSSLKGFINQRTRWTFKSKFYRDTDIIATAIIVLFTNLYLLVLLGLLFVNSAFIFDFLFAFMVKCVIDFILIFAVARFFSKARWLRYFLFHQVFYIFYVSVIGIMGHFSNFNWKNRPL